MINELRDQFTNEVIRASAGTGKTFALSNRYLSLLASGHKCDTILATTFTRKGAGEILDRIVQRLSDAALSDEAAEKLSDEMKFQLDRTRAASLLFGLMSNLHHLEISTLDSFFNRVAKAFSLELGLPPSWDIVEQQQIDQLHDQVTQNVLHGNDISNLLHMMSKGEAQRRIATLIRDTVKNIYDIYRHSPQDAWDQLPDPKGRLSEGELENIVMRMQAMDFKKGKQLPNHWAEVTKLAENGDWRGVCLTRSFQNVLAGNYKFGSSKLTPEILEIYDELLPHIVSLVTQQVISQNRATRDLLEQFRQKLERTKTETGQLRFDDVTERLKALVSLWNTDRFGFRLDRQIQHLLLDEFQDTSPEQWAIIRPFAKQVTQDDESKSFFCVGDMKQAIFGWRGGVAEIFDLVDEELPNLSEATPLSTSYRSSQPVIDLVNGVFSNFANYCSDDEVVDEAIHSWPEWFNEHSTAKKDVLDGYVTLERAPDCAKELHFPDTTKHRARNNLVYDRTIDQVKRLVQQLNSEQTIGILVRTNKAVGDIIYRLQRVDIEASEEGGNPITDSAAVEIVLSAITLIDHPGDSVARYHLSHSPLADEFGLKPESDQNQRENNEAAHHGAAAMRRRLFREGLGPIVEAFAKKLANMCTRRETLRLQHLVQIAFSSSATNDTWLHRPSKFVAYVREDVKVSDQSSAQVRVMTIHQSKGLEFDAVVYPMLLSTQGFSGFTPTVVVGRDSPTEPIKMASRYLGKELRQLLPKNFQQMFDEDRQRVIRESMCLLYVALTRAVHSIHIIMSFGAKPDLKSPEAILLSSLTPESGEKGFERKAGVFYQIGNPTWFQKPLLKTPEPEPETDLNLESFYLPENAELTTDAILTQTKSGRGRRTVGPSSLEGGSMLQLSSIFSRQENMAALDRGTMIHGCFAQVSWLDQTMPARQELIQQLMMIDSTVENIETYVDQFETMLEHETIKELLSLQTYQQHYMADVANSDGMIFDALRVEVQTERPFAVNMAEGLFQGFIDRVVWVYEGDRLVAADVIDIKTDAVDAATLESRVEHYRPQLNAYRRSVAQFAKLPLEKITARLLFVGSGELIAVPHEEADASEGTHVVVPDTNKLVSPPPPKSKSKPDSQTSSKPKTPSASKSSSTPNSEAKERVETKGPHRKSSGNQKTFWDD